jgi:dTMP kinase
VDHLDAEILPQLAEGVQVVSDRYYHSSLTYQALQGDLAWIKALNARARAPDLTFLLDVPAREAAARRLRVRAGEELYERDSVQERLELAYRQLPAMLPSEAMVVLDGRQDIQTVHRQIFEELVRRFGWG